MSREIDLTQEVGELQGSLSIARPTGADEEYIKIELQDELSGTRCVELRISLSGFAKALTGQGYVPCWFEFRSALVGMRAENKSELISRPPYGVGDYDRILLENMQGFEVDGWRGRRSDLTNGHCSVRTKEGDFQRVAFFRHVDPETENPVG